MRIIVTDTRYVDLDFINARTLLLTHNLETPKIIKDQNEITEIQFYGYSIKVGDTLEINVSKTGKNKIKRFFVNQIIENQKGFNIVSEELNKTSVYIFPLLVRKNETGQLYDFDTYFYNAYLYNNNPEYEQFNDSKHLFVVYRFFDDDRFKALEELITRNENYIKTIEPNGDFTMYIFEIPKLQQSNAFFVRKGKYSSLTATGKSKIITFHKAGQGDWLYKVLSKDKGLKREMEYQLDCDIPEEIDLCSKPVKTQETYYN